MSKINFNELTYFITLRDHCQRLFGMNVVKGSLTINYCQLLRRLHLMSR